MDVQLRAAWVLLSLAVFGPVVVAREAFSQDSAVSAHDAFDCFGQIVQQVPGVGHLPGLRSTRLGSVAEGVGAVAADHPHLGMISQPGREGARGAIGKHVDRTVGGHVDEDRRVGPSASHGELVDAEKRDRARGRERQRADQPEQSVWRADGV